MTTKSLHFKWTVSRGMDTYGYNICTLLVDGEKVGKCLGGGYDMQGTSFAQWLELSYQTELLSKLEPLAVITAARHYPTKDGLVSYFAIDKLYGVNLMEIKKSDGSIQKSICLDGAAGMNSMERIAEAIGIKLQWNKESNKYKNHTFYTAIIN